MHFKSCEDYVAYFVSKINNELLSYSKGCLPHVNLSLWYRASYLRGIELYDTVMKTKLLS